MTERKYIEAKLQREFGMDAESQLRLSKFNEEQTDWYTTCPNGHERRGTMAELRKPCPKCEIANAKAS